MAIKIRPRTDADLAALAKVLTEVHAKDGYPVEGIDDPLAWLGTLDGIGSWVADVNGEPVGHVALTQPGAGDEAPRLFADQIGPEPTAVLGRLFVSPLARGQGLATHLARKAMDGAADAGRRPVLDVMVKDDAAIRLYKQLGWTILNRFEHKFGEDQSENALAMYAPGPQ